MVVWEQLLWYSTFAICLLLLQKVPLVSENVVIITLTLFIIFPCQIY